jgi:alkanesulfonate monooxygenase SsuD/methylene tetrahydromethanopterin reductase-like flavin-dependent oxidoreductase (luciferase family)
MLHLVGAKGDGWLPSLSYMQSLTDLSDANALIDEAAAAAGREPQAVRRLLNIAGRFGPASDQLLSGPPEQWAEQLAVLALDYGVSAFVLMGDDAASIARFGEEVIAPAQDL